MKSENESHLVVSDSVRPYGLQPTRLHCPWDSPGKNTGVAVIKKKAFESILMRWMKLEPIIQSEVSQKEKHQYSMPVLLLLSCFCHVQLCNPMDFSPTSSSFHGILQVRLLEGVAISLSGGSPQPKD